MNYRHAFHAGNFADVVKHVVLVCLLRRLTAKPKPMCYVETHAGRGFYDLEGEAARRSGEARAGVYRLAHAAAAHGPVAVYLGVLREINRAGALRIYPGSPGIAAAVLRPEDRAILCELDPGESSALKSAFRSDRRFTVRAEDGYSALPAILPPPIRRGLVMIDPPYESPDETDRVLEALTSGLTRWRTGIFAIWYPIKERRDAAILRRRLAHLGEPVIALEFCVTPDDNPARLNGAGMAICRPPWQIETCLAEACRQLESALCNGRAARAEIIKVSDGQGNVKSPSRQPSASRSCPRAGRIPG
jgi:23S rRNA (adenine2030-N6)-methyltransferase